MGKFAHAFKCICAFVALGILVTGLASQLDKATEMTVSSANAVFAASVSEDYTDTETEHATIRRTSVLTAMEVSKEVTGGNSGELIIRRLATGANSTELVRCLTLLSILMAGACYAVATHHAVVCAEGKVHSAEQTVISYIHSQGNFIG